MIPFVLDCVLNLFISHKFIDSPIKGPHGTYTYTILAFITIVL